MTDEPKKEEMEPQDTKVKVGEKEYSQDELSQLVGLGETAQEFETKWNRKIGDFYPDYTQKSQKLAEFEKAEADRQRAELQAKADANELSPEESRRLVLQQAKEYGLLTKDELEGEVNARVANAMAAKEIINTTGEVINQAVEKGQPKTSVEDLLKYMDENGIRNPASAYKLKFEAEIDKWKEDKLSGMKPKGLETQEGSTAGAKQPEAVKPVHSREELNNRVGEFLKGRMGQ
mgnify:CR=1 FL=1